MSHRNYRNSLDFVADAFRACWGNAQDLVAESKLLLDHGHRGRALSLSILAVEELGKLFCVDGLLFARTDDDKATAFAKSLKSHATKLSAFELLPLLLRNISLTDPRYGKEKRFMQADLISAKDLRDRGNAVLALLNDGGFAELDHWKQTGFYSRPLQDGFIKPNDAVTAEMSEAVYMLAWRASSNLDFLLKNGGLERYVELARQLRGRLSEEDHKALLAAGAEMAQLLFSSNDDDDSGKPLH